jgi:two-component system LytT family response regulator
LLNVLIVDDERLARVELNRLLAKFDFVNVVAQASNGQQAVELLEQHAVDLVFLDIQMPEMTGLELAQQLDPSVKFVFCTAYNEHAVDAFSLNAIDYIVKPINIDRLKQTLERVQNTLVSDDKEVVGYLPDNHGLLLKIGDSSRIVRLEEIERFESIGNHVAVYTSQGKSYIHSSLSNVEKRLNPAQFFKTSRSEIVRIDSIQRLEEGIAAGSLIAIMKSNQQVDVSRRQVQTLKQLFNVF